MSRSSGPLWWRVFRDRWRRFWWDSGWVVYRGPVLPSERELFLGIFGHDPPAPGPQAGEWSSRFGRNLFVVGPATHRVRCSDCSELGPDAGTADAALAWIVVHRSEDAGHRSFRLVATSRVRIRPAPPEPEETW